MNKNDIKKAIEASIEVKTLMLNDVKLIDEVEVVIQLIVDAFNNGNRVIFAGNGGSAADAQHLAAEFVSRFEFDRPGLPALSLATDTSMLTAIGNDYGYDRLFQRQLEAQARPGDIFIGITTSGKSKNILAAFNVCVGLGVKSVALCGAPGITGFSPDYILRAPSFHTPRIQECHIVLGHVICAEVEKSIFSNFAPKNL